MDKRDWENLANVIVLSLNIFKNEWKALDDIDRKNWKKLAEDVSDAIKEFSEDLTRFK